MRVFKLTLVALAATFAWSSLAEAIEVKKRIEAPGTPSGVWAMVGDFCAIKDWHDAVAECEQFEEGGDTYRTLTLGDGGKIKEKLTNKGDTTYSYVIVESPLPVKNYASTLTVGKDDEANTVAIVWVGKFDAADGVEDAKAEEVIAGIYDAGLSKIKEKATAASN